MIRPPFMARVAAGMAITAYEEALKLPSTAVTLPMTAISQVLQTTMRLQQSMTALAIKGDQAFCLFERAEEEPSWAVFDEDRTDGDADVEEPSDAPDADVERPSTPGRFALYSMTPTEDGDGADDPSPEAKAMAPARAAHDVPVPEIAEELDYAALTLAQLRSRLRALSVEDLTALLEYEERTAARAPFQTMLTNRITSAKAK